MLEHDQEQQGEQESTSVFTPGLAAMRNEDDGFDGSAVKGGGLGAKRHLIVAGVLVLGAGLLYFMRQAGTGPRAANAEVEIDYEFADAEAARSVARQEQVIEGLRRAGPPSQLPPDDLGKNPFQLSTAQPGSNGDSGMDEANRQSSRMSVALRGLRLQAVIDGRVPIARISGKTYRIGDRVGEFFEIREIGGRAVVLSGPEGEHRLEMSTDG